MLGIERAVVADGWSSKGPFTRRSVLALLGSSAAFLPRSRDIAVPAELAHALTPEQFGARGDGVADDTQAFLDLSKHLNRNDGGVVLLRRGATYLIGRQSFGGASYLTGHPILFAENVSRLEVWMNGATLKFKDGLKFGSFNRHSGGPLETRLPHMSMADRADIGYAIMARNVGYFMVTGGQIDCNSREAVVGGLWGDVGRQCVHYGIAAFSCANVRWTDLRIFDSCLDGLVYGYTGLAGHHPPKPLFVRNVVVSCAARNCISVVGTNDAVFEECTFERAGEAPNRRLGSIRSAPAACFDLEAEEAECRNVRIQNASLLSGVGTAAAFIADSGTSSDILISDTRLVGAVWTSKPRTVFNRCTIEGIFARLYGGDRRSDNNSKILSCQISDALPRDAGGGTPINLIDLEGAGAGVQITGGTLTARHTRLNLRGGILQNVTITFATGTNVIRNRDFAILADDAQFDGVAIVEQIPNSLQPADAFFVTSPRPNALASLSSAGSKLMWKSWSAAAGGYTGRFRNH